MNVRLVIQDHKQENVMPHLLREKTEEVLQPEIQIPQEEMKRHQKYLKITLGQVQKGVPTESHLYLRAAQKQAEAKQLLINLIELTTTLLEAAETEVDHNFGLGFIPLLKAIS